MLSDKRNFIIKLFRCLLTFSGLALFLFACAPIRTNGINTQVSPAEPTTTPDWFDMELTDALTGKVFTINDFAGKVILLDTMAMWCPNCVIQATQVEKLHEALGHPDDLITVSLDVDINEDEAALKEYVSSYRFDWYFAVAPLGVARALGNLYSAEYLNPPLSPMMIIDRDGNVHQLEYGIKKVDTLQRVLEPFLEEK